MSSLNQESLLMKLAEKLSNIKVGEIALIKIEQIAAKLGVDEKRLLDLYVKTKNAAYKDKFSFTPFSERVLLLPQCLRSRNCIAKRTSYGYECVSCGRCKISQAVKMAKKLGYKGIFIISGGTVVNTIIKKERPKACLAVACLHELVLGSLFTEKMGIVAQGVQLAKDGCVDTILDWTKLNSAMRLSIKR